MAMERCYDEMDRYYDAMLKARWIGSNVTMRWRDVTMRWRDVTMRCSKTRWRLRDVTMRFCDVVMRCSKARWGDVRGRLIS